MLNKQILKVMKTLIETGYSTQVTPNVDFDEWFDFALDERKQEKELEVLRAIRNIESVESNHNIKYNDCRFDSEQAIIKKQDNDKRYW